MSWETNASTTPLSKQEAEHFRRRREQLVAVLAHRIARKLNWRPLRPERG